MCVLFSLSGLLWSVGAIYWKNETLYLWITAQSCMTYTIGHWLFSYHYYKVATGARIIVENGPEAHASSFKQGWFNLLALILQVALIEGATFVQYIYQSEIEYQEVMICIINIVQTVIFVYALLLIRALLRSYPELKEGNKMMSLHMLIFNFFVLISMVHVFLIIFLYDSDNKIAEITCQIVIYTRAVSYFSVFTFLAYLMIWFSNPPK